MEEENVQSGVDKNAHDLAVSPESNVLDLTEVKNALLDRISLLNKSLKDMTKEKKLNPKIGEAFNLLLAEVQSIKEFGALVELENKVRDLEANNGTKEEIIDAKGRVNGQKDWFGKFNKSVLDSYHRINDRDARSKDAENVGQLLALPQLHQIIVGKKVEE